MNRYEADELLGVMEFMFEQFIVEEPAPVADGPSDVEISENVSGTPDLHIRNPAQFAKMAKYYNPAKEPFTSSSWMRTGMLGKDIRPLKPVNVNGVMARPVSEQHGAPWVYWKMRGYIKDEAGNWYKKV